VLAWQSCAEFSCDRNVQKGPTRDFLQKVFNSTFVATLLEKISLCGCVLALCFFIRKVLYDDKSIARCSGLASLISVSSSLI
jgi:hypothetical protein